MQSSHQLCRPPFFFWPSPDYNETHQMYPQISHSYRSHHYQCDTVNSDLQSKIIISHMSDHFPIFHCIKSVTPIQPPNFIESRNFSKSNLTKFNDTLLRFDWSNVISSNDMQISYSNFSDSFFTLYNLDFPLKKIKFNKKYHKLEIWMSSGLLTSRREKNLSF